MAAEGVVEDGEEEVVTAVIEGAIAAGKQTMYMSVVWCTLYARCVCDNLF